MNSRVIGSILLIVAMSIGGGLLSLPVVTAASGFWYSSLMLCVIWLVSTLGALFILEVCLWFPDGANLMSMAKKTLGLPGQMLMWFFYLLMLYCILCAYVSGGTDLVNSIWQSLHISAPDWLSTILFVAVLGTFVWHGIRLIDHTNRALMTAKMSIYMLLVIILIPAVHVNNLPSGTLTAITMAIMPAIFSFGYAIIIPSLRTYLQGDVKKLRLVVLIGSFIPLVCFILWDYIVQGTMPKEQLLAMANNGQVVSQLNAGLSEAGNPWIITLTHIFTTICLLTAFLAVSLSLSDFIANGLNKQKLGWNKTLIYALTFLPPLFIILFNPYIFITAIRYAGIFVVVILMLMPTLMVIRGRAQSFAIGAPYRVPGGVITTSIMLLASLGLLGFAIFQG